MVQEVGNEKADAVGNLFFNMIGVQCIQVASLFTSTENVFLCVFFSIQGLIPYWKWNYLMSWESNREHGTMQQTPEQGLVYNLKGHTLQHPDREFVNISRSPVTEIIYRPSFRENKPKTLVLYDWKRAFWACFSRKLGL